MTWEEAGWWGGTDKMVSDKKEPLEAVWSGYYVTGQSDRPILYHKVRDNHAANNGRNFRFIPPNWCSPS